MAESARKPWEPTREDIEEMARVIAEQFDPEKIILFGSHAYGTTGSDSDVDLMVIMETDERRPRVAGKIRGLLPSRFAVDVLVRTPKDVQERLRICDYFMLDVFEKGVVLYDRQSRGPGKDVMVLPDPATVEWSYMIEGVKEWLAKAEADLRMARDNLELSPEPNYDGICFHAQQSAEKLLKALLIAHRTRFSKVHDLEILLDLLPDPVPQLERLRSDLKTLSDYAVEVRYPMAFAIEEEARAALATAESVRAIVLPLLEEHL